MAQSLREKIKNLSPEKKEELKQYAESIKEIKRKISAMLSGTDKVEEAGGNMTGKHLSTEVGNPSDVEIAYTDRGRFYYAKIKGERYRNEDEASKAISQMLGSPVKLPWSTNEFGKDKELDAIVQRLKQKGISAGWHDAIDHS